MPYECQKDIIITCICSSSGIKVDFFIADAPKRKWLMKMSNFNSYYGCDCCCSRSTYLRYDGRAGKIVWPPSTGLDPVLRSDEHILHEANKPGEVSIHNPKFGVRGLSHLFDLNNFSPTQQVLPEAMHLIFLGIVKLLVQLCFALGQKRASISRASRMTTAAISYKLLEVKVPCEVST